MPEPNLTISALAFETVIISFPTTWSGVIKAYGVFLPILSASIQKTIPDKVVLFPGVPVRFGISFKCGTLDFI